MSLPKVETLGPAACFPARTAAFCRILPVPFDEKPLSQSLLDTRYRLSWRLLLGYELWLTHPTISLPEVPGVLFVYEIRHSPVKMITIPRDTKNRKGFLCGSSC